MSGKKRTRGQDRLTAPKKPAAGGYGFAQTILDSLSAHVAILDENGFILETNLAWKRFARQNRIQMRPDTREVNYLEVCDKASGEFAGESSRVARCIREVIAGRRREFVMDYPCHSPDEKRWFNMRVTRARGPGPVRIVVSHENITDLKLAHKRLRLGEEALQREKQKLLEANAALKVILHQREQDRRETETAMLDNMHRLVLPAVRGLETQNLPQSAKKRVASLKTRLAQLARPFLRRLSAIESSLTPREFEVAVFIREGRTTKEIADLLHLSIPTVNFHRRNLRKKLHLANTGANLRSFLMGLKK